MVTRRVASPDTMSPGRDPPHTFGIVAQSIGNPTTTPYLRNSARDCIDKVMNDLDDAWETIKNKPVEESLPVAFARLMGHLIGVYDRYYGY